MPVVVRRLDRRDRDHLTDLLNLHVGAVVPGVVVSVNAVLAHLEREPGEAVVDPWVAERCCLVAERDGRVVAAALLHRFRTDDDVAEHYRGTGDVRWLLCRVDALDAGRSLLARALAVMTAWGVRTVGADCALPALGCHGVPDVAPHLRALLDDAGFGAPTRTEHVLVATCEHLAGAVGTGATEPVARRRVGTLGTRLDVTVGADDLGWIEVCRPDAQQARHESGAAWADVGNLVVAAGADPAVAAPTLLAVAARWLLLGGVTRLVAYWAADVDTAADLDLLHAAGFTTLVVNERGFTRDLGPTPNRR